MRHSAADRVPSYSTTFYTSLCGDGPWSKLQISTRSLRTVQRARCSSPEASREWLKEQEEKFHRILRQFLPRRGRKKLSRNPGTRIAQSTIKDAVSIHQHPWWINARLVTGHWEVDFMIGARSSGDSEYIAQFQKAAEGLELPDLHNILKLTEKMCTNTREKNLHLHCKVQEIVEGTSPGDNANSSPVTEQLEEILVASIATPPVPEETLTHTPPVPEETPIQKLALALAERYTGWLIAILLTRKKSEWVMHKIILILTVTFDRGGEFTFHQILKTRNILTFFCDAGCPNQKGLVENRIGKMRYTLTKELNFGDLTQEILDDITTGLNKEIFRNRGTSALKELGRILRARGFTQ